MSPVNDTFLVDADTPLCAEVNSAASALLAAGSRLANVLGRDGETAADRRKQRLSHALQAAIRLALLDGETDDRDVWVSLMTTLGWFYTVQKLTPDPVEFARTVSISTQIACQLAAEASPDFPTVGEA